VLNVECRLAGFAEVVEKLGGIRRGPVDLVERHPPAREVVVLQVDND
jgi:hypothetical protein